MMQLMLSAVSVKQNILDDDKYKFLFSVEEVNKLVLSGMPFRDAYKKVGQDIENGSYKPATTINHTHEGSIGNLCLDEVTASMHRCIAGFEFEKAKKALSSLLS
jgi:argininosuccinate lyase